MLNLDAMSREELDKAYKNLKLLINYTVHMDSAIHYRESGRIDLAKYHEDRCQKIYEKLDEEYRW